MLHKLVVLLVLFVASTQAQAASWWNKEWPYRTRVSVATEGALASLVPVRLTVANFPFHEALADAADLRFVAADDKTLLPFAIETFDAAEQLAVVWVQLPPAAGQARSFWLYYGNKRAQPARLQGSVYGAEDAAVFHFAQRSGEPIDETENAVRPAQFTARAGAGGIAGNGAAFAVNQRMTLADGPASRLRNDPGFTISAWVKLTDVKGPSLIVSRGRDSRSAHIEFGVANGRLFARASDGRVREQIESSTPLVAGRWHHVGLAVGDRMAIFLDGALVGSGGRPPGAPEGELVVGEHPRLGAGFVGEMDAFAVVAAARPAAWFAAQFAVQQADAPAVLLEAEERTGTDAYLAILRTLLHAVSRDGWVIIALIGVLGFISGEVMLRKLLLLRRIERSNLSFLERFRGNQGDVGDLAEEGAAASRWRDSSLFALYHGGLNEFRRQAAALDAAGGGGFGAERLDVIKASIDTAIVNEAQRLNKWMVLLTLSVSAAPFLGLLGTVVGIMVTFGAIAMVGDVNVNTIAPGVAAALATTVAGLAVAIPVMFGYNYLATKIRELTALMEVFANELQGRLALARAAR